MSKLHAKMHNSFKIEVIDSKTNEIKQEAEAYNVICAKTWANGYLNPDSICYGEGTGTPASSDTAMFNRIGSVGTSVVSDTFDHVNHTRVIVTKASIGTSVAVGKTITEVGLGSGSSGDLRTHALLQDQNGEPISITKTDTDVIWFYATVYYYMSYDEGVIPIYGRENFLRCMRNGGIYNDEETGGNEIYPRIGLANGSIFYYSSRFGKRMGFLSSWHGGISVSYDSSTKKRTSSIKRVLENDANGSTIGWRYIVMGCNFYSYPGESDYVLFKIGNDSSTFPYSQLTNESIGTGDGITKDFSFKFMYPRDVEIKINGVVVDPSEYSVDYAPPIITDFCVATDQYSTKSTIDNLIWVGVDDTEIILHNPAYVIGLQSFTVQPGDVDVSDDMVNWTTIDTPSVAGTYTIPSNHQNHKYYRYHRLKPQRTDEGGFAFNNPYNILPVSSYTGKNLHFNTAPAQDAIITASYKADCIAKDTDHIVDIGSFEFSFGEYTP